MALENCVQQVLCGLTNTTRIALSNFIRAQVATLQTALIPLQAKLAYLDLVTAPLRLIASAAQAAKDQLIAGASIVPIDLIGNCLGINEITDAIQITLDTKLSEINAVLDELQRLLSLRDEVQAAIAQINRTISLLNEVLETIDSCPDFLENLNL